jgi:uncharacterized RDD family membrane protein YckC
VFCSKCGANLAADAAFCGSCGTSAGRLASSAPLQPLPPAYAGASGHVPYADPAGLVVSRGFTFAGFWLRVVAYLLDSVILGAAVLVLFLPLVFLTGLSANFEAIAQSHHGQPNAAVIGGFIAMMLVFVLISILIQWLYHAYLESGEKQATWGKQALGIYVTDLMGNRVTFGRASGRFFAKIVTGMIPLGIGYIMAGFTERKQALHDMMAGSLVLRR